MEKKEGKMLTDQRKHISILKLYKHNVNLLGQPTHSMLQSATQYL